MKKYKFEGKVVSVMLRALESLEQTCDLAARCAPPEPEEGAIMPGAMTCDIIMMPRHAFI